MNDYMTIPWDIEQRHSQERPARMLGLLARTKAGESLSLPDEQRLRRWQRCLDDDGVVVAYCPSANPGFYYVLADEPGDAPEGVPVRPRLLSIEELLGPEQVDRRPTPEPVADREVSTGTRTAGVFEWYCDVHDTQGNADSRAEAEHVAASHAEFFLHQDPESEPCDLLVYQTRERFT